MGVDGEVITCTATATDLSGGVSTATDAHTITNTSPVIDAISLSPATPDVNTSSLSCNVSASDADGDSVSISYQWDINGAVDAETSATYSGPFVVGSVITCTATPDDGKNSGSSSQAAATVDNTLPVVDSVSLSPVPPTPTTRSRYLLQCSMMTAANL